MCTAITYKTKDHYFGRNLDLEYSYKETVTVTPRNYVFDFRKMGKLESHFAMVGMAYIADGYPLYYDATNEKGLSAAGLNFPENADYKAYCDGKENVGALRTDPVAFGAMRHSGRCGKAVGEDQYSEGKFQRGTSRIAAALDHLRQGALYYAGVCKIRS